MKLNYLQVYEYITDLCGTGNIPQLLSRLPVIFEDIIGKNLYFSFWIKDPDKALLLLAKENGYKGEGLAEIYPSISLKEQLLGKSLGEQKSVIINDILDIELPILKNFLSNEKIRSIIILPLISKTDVIGSILLGKRMVCNWQKLNDTLMFLATLIALLFEETHLRQESIFWHEISLQCADYQRHHGSFLSQISQYVCKYFHSRGCGILITDSYTGKPVVAGSTNPLIVGKEYNLGEGLTGYVAKHRKALRLIRMGNADELASLDSDLTWEHKLSDHQPLNADDHYIAVPILAGNNEDSLLGVIRVTRDGRDSPFFPYEEKLLSAVSYELLLIHRLTELLKARESELSVLISIQNAVVGKNRDEIYHLLLDVAIQITNAKCGYIAIPEPNDQLLKVVAHHNMDPKFVIKYRSINAGVAGRAFEEKQIIACSDLESRKKFCNDLCTEYQSELAVPLMENNKAVGVLNLHDPLEHKFSGHHSDLISCLSSICLLSHRQFESEHTRVRVLLESLRHFQRCDIESLNDMGAAMDDILVDACQQFGAENSLFIASSFEGHHEVIAGSFDLEYHVLESAINRWDAAIGNSGKACIEDYKGISPELAAGAPKEYALVYRHSIADLGRAYIYFSGTKQFSQFDEELKIADIFSDVLLATYTRFVVNQHGLRMRRAMDQANLGQQLDHMSLGFGHEARNAVNNLYAIIQSARDDFGGNCPKEVMSVFSEIETVCKSLADLAEKFLGYTRPIKKSYLYLSDVVGLYATLLRKAAKENKVTLVPVLAEHLTSRKAEYKNNTVFIDSSQIGQILSNLVSNAIAAKMGESGKIEITTRTGKPEGKSGKWAILEVRDFGRGIPKDKQNIVWQAGVTTTGGYGLGLHIVRRLVEQNNGLIELISEQNKGALFRVYFPIIREEI